jgi:hypothetical protein
MIGQLHAYGMSKAILSREYSPIIWEFTAATSFREVLARLAGLKEGFNPIAFAIRKSPPSLFI